MPHYTQALEVDCKTGKHKWRDLTPEEVADRDAIRAAAEADERAKQEKERTRQEALARLKTTAAADDEIRDILKAIGEWNDERK